MRTIDPRIANLSGYAPALPTPFFEDGSIDFASFERLCDRQIREGTSALVVCGTTGEAPTLSTSEQRALTRAAVCVSQGRVPVIAGAGSNATAHAVELTRNAEQAGADAILSIVPYYNKPSQAGLYAHFRMIAQSSGLPLFLYDVPSRTACNLADETVARLAELPLVIGLKDASGDASRPARLRAMLGPGFRLLSGDDATALAFLSQGGNGCISVTSNVAPGLCWEMFLAWRRGLTSLAERLAQPVATLTTCLFRETNPGPLKYALSLLGLTPAKLRLPLVEPAAETRAALSAVIAQLCDRYPEDMIGRVHEMEPRFCAGSQA